MVGLLIFILIIFIFILIQLGLYYEEIKYFIFSTVFFILLCFLIVISKLTITTETVKVVSNDVKVNSVLLKTCKPIEYTIKLTKHADWTGIPIAKDTVSIRILK